MATKQQEDSSTGVRVYKCEAWDDFIHAQRKSQGRFIGGYSFRGHAKLEWRLSSPFERWLLQKKGGNEERNVKKLFSDGAYEKFQEGNLNYFIDLAVGLPGLETTSLTRADWLTLARHHGLNSAILDWSQSPYVASFFAFVDALRIVNLQYGHELGAPTSGAIYSPIEPVAIWALANTDEIEVPGEFEFLRSRAAGVTPF